MTIAERIRNLRISINYTMDQVADYLGTTKQTVYKYENGIVTNIPLDKIERLSELFCVSPAYLTGWIDVNKGSVRSTYSTDRVPEMLVRFWSDLDEAGKDRLAQCLSNGYEQAFEFAESCSVQDSPLVFEDGDVAFLNSYHRLDAIDRGRIQERIDTMLEGEKYQKDTSLKNA